MKIGILTLQGAKNCGAVLQAYALCKVLNKMGYVAELINFISDREYARISYRGGKKGKAYWARKLYYGLFSGSIKKRNELFALFQKEYLNLYPRDKRIRESELENVSKRYSCIVCGSDQIWSQDPKLYDRSDAYFINFPYEGKRVSYAASFGDSIEAARKHISKIAAYLPRFDAVSVRESEAADFLKTAGISASVCVDPTLLLDAADWKKLAIFPSVSEKYILYFSVNSRKYSMDLAKRLSKETGLKIIELNPHPKSWNSGFEKLYGSGPREFLGYILQAEYVVSNSFHGTVFSILFHKPFLAAFDEKDGRMVLENRKANLLKKLGLESAMVSAGKKLDIQQLCSVDWMQVDKKIQELREESLAYLAKAVGEKQDDD